MSSITPNLKMNVPDFDQSPWDVDVNTNWTILDATVGMFSTVPNMTGTWKNSTAYAYGQSAIDAADSSVWFCVLANTSSPAPTSFANERTSFPAYWTIATQGAQFYADQAAQAASNAAASAAAAAASAASIVPSLPLAGGTMLGFITLNADPTALLHAVTKQYVDARVGGSGYLPLTGGVLTGGLTVGGNGVTYSVQAVANRHSIAFGWNGTVINATVDGVAAGNLATQAFLTSNYLPISGGSVTGTIICAGELQAAATLRLTSTGAYLTSSATYTQIAWDSGGWLLRYTRASGNLQYLNGSGTQLFAVSPAGIVTTAAGITAGGNVVCSANLYARGGNVYWGAGDRAHLSSDNSTYTNLNMLDNYAWSLSWSTGNLNWVRSDGTAIFILSPAGNLNISGNYATGGNVSAANVTASTSLFAAGGDAAFGPGGGGRILQFSNQWFWEWNSSNGNLRWIVPGTSSFEMRATDGLAGNNRGAVYGNGAYSNVSDERMKENIQPSTLGLAEIVQLEPISFTRIPMAGDTTTQPVENGFSAQQTLPIIPSAVSEVGVPLPGGAGGMGTASPTMAVMIDAIVVGVVNAIKELTTRVTALESK